MSDLLKKMIQDSISLRLGVGEEGAPAGGEGGVAVATDDAPGGDFERSDEFASGTLPKEVAEAALRGDPELREMQEQKKGKRAAANKKSKEGTPQGAEKVVEGEEVSPKPGDKAKEKVAEGVDPEFEALEFQDNVIPGLKGEHMKKAGPEAAAAIAEYYEKANESAQRLTAAEAELKKLKADPVIKHRDEMIASGKTEYNVRSVTPEEIQTAKQMVTQQLKTQLDLLPEEADKAFDVAFNVLRGGFEKMAKESAQDILNQGLVQSDAKQREANTFTKSMSVFMGMGKFNKDLQFTETDPSKMFVYKGNGKFEVNEKHPEAAKFTKSMLPVMESLGKAGFTYEQINKMSEEFGEDAVYSFAAKKLGLPVAINTQGRDQKIVSRAVNKALKPFIKGSAADGLPTDGGGESVSKERSAKGVSENGIDMNRILDDESYYDEQILRKPGDPAWMRIVSETRQKAARVRRQSTKK
jgi:hypothetical protein